jgi:hypothetical protein
MSKRIQVPVRIDGYAIVYLDDEVSEDAALAEAIQQVQESKVIMCGNKMNISNVEVDEHGAWVAD